jgi:NADP-dependent 3-hydroxy acid dehydrogenase YdfG
MPATELPRVLIVGASASVGGAVIRAFERAGAKVILTAHSGLARLHRSYPGTAILHLDLESDASLRACADAICRKARLSTVISLAGLLPGKSLPDYGFTEIERAVSVNFTGQAKLLSLIAPCLCDGGQILLMSSIAGERGSYDPI